MQLLPSSLSLISLKQTEPWKEVGLRYVAVDELVAEVCSQKTNEEKKVGNEKVELAAEKNQHLQIPPQFHSRNSDCLVDKFGHFVHCLQRLVSQLKETVVRLVAVRECLSAILLLLSAFRLHSCETPF